MTTILLVNGTDISDIAINCKYVSPWNNGASSFTFEYPASKAKVFPNGCVVVFAYGGNVFYGWLFKTSVNRGTLKCMCYDQIRYLTGDNKGMIMREIEPLDAFLNRVASTAGERIRLGKVDSTEFKLSRKNFDSKTFADMLYESIQENMYGNNYWYTLRDNFGALELRDTVDLRLPLVVGDKSRTTDFDYSISIDDGTTNYVKVGVDDKTIGVRNVVVAQDPANIAKWGKLGSYVKVSSEMNTAQLQEHANRLLFNKNHETETLKVDCIGDIRVRGGSGVKVELKQVGINIWAVVDSVTHNFSHMQHTMSMNLIFGRWY